MNETASPRAFAQQNPTSQRIEEVVDLVNIFESNIQICSLPRKLNPAALEYLSLLESQGELQLIETISKTDELQLERLPKDQGKEALLEDLSFLRDIVCDLVDCDAVGLRFARVNQAMCPGWHIDRVGIRLVCTYQGPGTQWLEDQSINRSLLGNIKNDDCPFIEAGEGEIVLLKGELWQGNEQFGSVHRSPEIIDATSMRTLVTIDPLWLN